MNPAEIMSHQPADGQASTLSLADQIIFEIASKHGLTVREIKTQTMAHRISHPRQEAMYELRRQTLLSTTQIARKFGLADHTTVTKGSDRHADRNGLPRIRTRDPIPARAEAEKAAA